MEPARGKDAGATRRDAVEAFDTAVALARATDSRKERYLHMQNALDVAVYLIHERVK